MRYWQLTEYNSLFMLGMLREYMRAGYLWQMKINELRNEVYEFIIVPNDDFNYSEKVKKSQWAMDVFGQELHMGDYLVERDNKLAVLTAEAIKELEEEDKEKMRDEEQSQEATECEKKALLEQLLEAYNKHEYTRSTILHNKLMEMGMTEKEIMGEVNALLCVKSKVEKEEIKPDDCKDEIADQEKSLLLNELVESCKNPNYARREYLQSKLIHMGVSMEEIKAKIDALIGAKSEIKEVDIKTSSTSPIDELQKILVRRAQLQKELAEIEETLSQKYEIKVNNTENK